MICPAWLTPDADAFATPIWPSTAAFQDGVLCIGGVAATQAADQWGTPLYLIDETDFRTRAATFRDAFAPWRVQYGSKAFLSRTVARWVFECGLGIDVCSLGELTVACQSGIAPVNICLHGNNKTTDELAAAIEAGVGHIVVDSFDEIDRIEALCGGRSSNAAVPVLVRVTPDVAVDTHASIQTAVADQKFGFALADGVALQALLRLADLAGVELRGVHCHVGSQIMTTNGYELAIARLVGLLAQFRDKTGRQLPECVVGGGFGIAYTVADQPMAPSTIAGCLQNAMNSAIAEHGLDRLDVSIEPGRSIVGPAGVALYTVGTVKPVPGRRTYISVDGGMSDNPRPALYQAEYTALLANRTSSAPPMLCRVVGKHCETGDIIVRHTYLPSDVRPGDLIAVPASGAYQRSMANNYNYSPRPPVVAVRDGQGMVILRRETIEDIMALDVGR
ncbi:MAG: diaminopimelate decarboxylase [Propionibacteriaceae bacterium]|nr:diaminopimelate decarboxylase [Propionibacteriaceae bacterium]